MSGVHFLVLSWCWDINSGRLTMEGGGGAFLCSKKSRPDDLRKRPTAVLAYWPHGLCMGEAYSRVNAGDNNCKEGSTLGKRMYQFGKQLTRSKEK